MSYTWQHFVASKECHDTKTEQVSKSDKHVEFQPKYSKKNKDTWKENQTNEMCSICTNISVVKVGLQTRYNHRACENFTFSFCPNNDKWNGEVLICRVTGTNLAIYDNEIYSLPKPRWNVIALRESGKFDMFTPSLAHKINSKRTGAKHKPVNRLETKAGGLFSGSRNICWNK